MTLSKGALGNLINRYRAVLTKCTLLNLFGSIALLGVVTLGGATLAAAANFSNGSIQNDGGLTSVIGLSSGEYTYDASTFTGTITGSTITIGDTAPQGGSVLQSRADSVFTHYPTLTLLGSTINATSDYTVLAGQSGTVNVGSASAYADTITLRSTYTNQQAAGATDLYSVLYAQGAYGDKGMINLYGKTINILTEANAYKDGAGKYGNAISGNYAGKVNIHATDALTIHGLIEGSNNLENDKGNGSSAMNFLIDAATAQTTILGSINAAGSSSVNIRMGANSSVTGDLIATANAKQAGGNITLLFTEGGQYQGNISVQDHGAITLSSNRAVVSANGQIIVSNGTFNGTNLNLTFSDTEELKHALSASGTEARVDLSGTTSITSTAPAGQRNSAIYAANGATVMIGSSQEATSISGDIEATSGSTVTLRGGKTFSVNGALAATEAASQIVLDGTGIYTISDGLSATDGGQIKLYGGTLDASSGLNLDGISANTKGLILDRAGILKTQSGQIFTNELNAEGKNTHAGPLNFNGEKIAFLGGALALTDSLYNIDYVLDAEATLGEQTDVVMLGSLVGATPTGSTGIKDLHGTGAILAQVDATTNGDLLVGQPSTSGTTGHANDLGVRTLDLGAAGSNVTVTGGHDLTLVGDGGSLIKTGNTQAPVTLTVGENDQSGALNLGVAGVAGGGTLNGSIEVASGSQVNVNGGSFTVDSDTGISSAGEVNVAAGSHLTASITLNDGTLNVSGTTVVPALTATSDSLIQIGNQGNAGRTVITNANLNGAAFFLDPAWSSTSTIDTASHAVLGGNTVNGRLTVGQNSLLVLGDSSTDWALKSFSDTGLTWGPSGITAALALRTPQTLDAGLGGITVDGSMTTGSVTYASPDNATFAAGSLFMVDAAAAAGGNTALTGSGTLTVADTAKLALVNAQSGQSYALTSFGNNAVAATGWQGSNLVLNRLLSGTLTDSNGKLTLSTTTNAVAYKTVIPNTLNSMVTSGLNDVNSANAGIAFLSRAFEPTYLPDDKAVVPTVDGAAQLSVAGGVQASTMRTALAPTRSIQDHLSLTGSEQTSMRKDGLNIWFDGMFGSDRARGFSGGSVNTGYNADFRGAIIGGDYTLNNFRAGLALNVGSGDTRSHGGFNKTKNDFDFWGVSAYGSWTLDNLNIIGDFGYSAADNTVKQDTPASMGVGQLKADIDSSVLTAGLRAEYLLHTELMDILPHAGVRYLGITTDSYTTKSAAGDVFHTDKDLQHVWQLPVGVALSKTFTTDSGWSLTPRADLSVVPSVGDTKTKLDVRVPGINAADGISRRVIDGTSFDGVFGIQAAKENIAVGLNYNIQASEHVTGHGVTASFTYKF